MTFSENEISTDTKLMSCTIKFLNGTFKVRGGHLTSNMARKPLDDSLSTNFTPEVAKWFLLANMVPYHVPSNRMMSSRHRLLLTRSTVALPWSSPGPLQIAER